MVVLEFRWRTRDIDTIDKWSEKEWISGFTINHHSWAYCRNDGQVKEIEGLAADGLVSIVRRTERE